MLKKVLLVIFLILLLIVLGFYLGPKPSYPAIDSEPLSLNISFEDIEKYVADKESQVAFLKKDNEARIVWADSTHQKTKYSIVYIHGFSASQGEGFPIHQNIADSLGANLFLARLYDHGINSKEAFKEITPSKLIDDAKEAIAIGKIIGDTVIVMSCSTGSTLSIYLAANDPEINSLVLLSPNIALNSEAATIMSGPWGRQLAHWILGDYRMLDSIQCYYPYWSCQYHVEGLIALQSLMNQTMTNEVFEKITQPVYCGYYYKNEEEQDPVVSVPAMMIFKNLINTPPALLEFEAFPDARNHVIGSIYRTQNWQTVEREVYDFLFRIYPSLSATRQEIPLQ